MSGCYDDQEDDVIELLNGFGSRKRFQVVNNNQPSFQPTRPIISDVKCTSKESTLKEVHNLASNIDKDKKKEYYVEEKINRVDNSIKYSDNGRRESYKSNSRAGRDSSSSDNDDNGDRNYDHYGNNGIDEGESSSSNESNNDEDSYSSNDEQKLRSKNIYSVSSSVNRNDNDISTNHEIPQGRNRKKIVVQKYRTMKGDSQQMQNKKLNSENMVKCKKSTNLVEDRVLIKKSIEKAQNSGLFVKFDNNINNNTINKISPKDNSKYKDNSNKPINSIDSSSPKISSNASQNAVNIPDQIDESIKYDDMKIKTLQLRLTGQLHTIKV
jgi:hypothetical protein